METKQVIVVRKDLNMDAGKMSAQVGHAVMAWLTKPANHRGRALMTVLSTAQEDWLSNSYPKVVLECYSEQELRDLIGKGRSAGIEVNEVVDNGATVFHGVPTLTCAAFGPDTVERINPITGRLRPYHQDLSATGEL